MYYDEKILIFNYKTFYAYGQWISTARVISAQRLALFSFFFLIYLFYPSLVFIKLYKKYFYIRIIYNF